MNRREFLGQEPDALDRWRADAERQEKRFAEERAREQEAEDERQAKLAAIEAASLRAAFDQRITALEQENADLWANLLEGARAMRYAIEVIADEHVELSREQREELRDLRAEVAKLHSALTELRKERSPSFQGFAREKDAEVVDLPNFLPRRVN